MLDRYEASQEVNKAPVEEVKTEERMIEDDMHLIDDRTSEEIAKTEEEVDLYNIKNFSV